MPLTLYVDKGLQLFVLDYDKGFGFMTKIYSVDFKSQPPKHIFLTMKIMLAIFSVAISFVLAQDTYNCPDGWELFVS